MLATSIAVPDALELDGLHFRCPRGEADADALYAVHAGRVARDRVDLLSNLEDMPSRDELGRFLSDMAAAGEQDRWLVAEVHDQVVGYTHIGVWPEEDGNWAYLILGWVLPEWRGRGIGTAMLHWGEEWARHAAAAQHPHERFEFAANASCTEADATALLLHEGYAVGFTDLQMYLDPSVVQPKRPLPEGIELRPALPEHYPLLVSSINESYQNEFPGNRFRSSFDRVAYFSAWLSDPKRDPNLYYVAWDGDQVAGQVIVLIQDGRAEVEQVCIRPAWRRMGLGRALLAHALSEVRERGVEVVWLNTIAEYPTRAVDMYRSMGFEVVKEFRRYRKAPGGLVGADPG